MTNQTAIKIATACENAYSYDRWSKKGFQDVAVILLDRGLTPLEVIAVLCSKEMRWAADFCAEKNEEYNFIPAKRFTEYDKNRMNSEIAQTYMWDDMPTID